MKLPPLAVLAGTGIAAALAGCGGSGKQSAPASGPVTSRAATTAARVRSTPHTGAATTSAGALQAEANAAATGDIPDNQVFLRFDNRAGGYSIKYPEGWAQSGGGSLLVFRDKNNIVRVVVAKAPAPTGARIRSEVASLKGAHPAGGPRRLTISDAPAYEVVYTTRSAASAVTGKRVTLTVDRYYLWHGGKEAIVDLGTPQGVDNVDAFRLMIESFRWT